MSTLFYTKIRHHPASGNQDQETTAKAMDTRGEVHQGEEKKTMEHLGSLSASKKQPHTGDKECEVAQKEEEGKEEEKYFM